MFPSRAHTHTHTHCLTYKFTHIETKNGKECLLEGATELVVGTMP